MTSLGHIPPQIMTSQSEAEASCSVSEPRGQFKHLLQVFVSELNFQIRLFFGHEGASG